MGDQGFGGQEGNPSARAREGRGGLGRPNDACDCHCAGRGLLDLESRRWAHRGSRSGLFAAAVGRKGGMGEGGGVRVSRAGEGTGREGDGEGKGRE